MSVVTTFAKAVQALTGGGGAGVAAGHGSRDKVDAALKRIARLGLSERQQALQQLWGVYKCTQYDTRKLDWDGRQIPTPGEREQISTSGYMPPGFVDANKQAQPLSIKYRRPSAPLALIKVIVDRFTGLLFSEQQHPEIKVDGDPDTEDWLHGVADASRLWQQMILARTYGGAMGTVAVSFQFVAGKPVVEVHDPRWLFPTFAEHGSHVLTCLEKRYFYPEEIQDPNTGRWKTELFWYRRIIDEQKDTLYAPAPVGSGDEPEWQVQREVPHGLGWCPAVWIQNLPQQDSEDGDPDCPPHAYTTAEQIDALLSQANRATLATCDPQMVITSKGEMGNITPGLDNALKVPDGDVKFLEIAASGIKMAVDLAKIHRENVLETCQCVLEQPDTSGKTATEVERMLGTMIAKADQLREQYGSSGVVLLLGMIHKAAVALGQPRPRPLPAPAETAPPVAPDEPEPGTPGPPDGSVPQAPAVQGAPLVRQVVILPPRYEKMPDGTVEIIERQPGRGGTITLRWPGYFQPSVQDVNTAVQAAVSAKDGGVVDDETAISFVAPYFKVEDKGNLVDKVRASAAEQMAREVEMMASAMNSPAHAAAVGGPATEPPGAPPGPPGEAPSAPI